MDPYAQQLADAMRPQPMPIHRLAAPVERHPLIPAGAMKAASLVAADMGRRRDASPEGLARTLGKVALGAGAGALGALAMRSLPQPWGERAQAIAKALDGVSVSATGDGFQFGIRRAF